MLNICRKFKQWDLLTWHPEEQATLPVLEVGVDTLWHFDWADPIDKTDTVTRHGPQQPLLFTLTPVSIQKPPHKTLGYLQYRAMKLNLTLVAMWVMPFDCGSTVIANPGRFQGNPQLLMVNHSIYVVWHQSQLWWSSKGDVMSKRFLSQAMTKTSWTCCLQGITLHFCRTN